MSQFVEAPTKAFTAGAAIGQHIRVGVVSSKLAVAGVDDPGIGTICNPTFADLEKASVRLWGAQGTRKGVASEAITAFTSVYAAASGKLSQTGNLLMGLSLEAASANNSVFEFLAMPSLLGHVIAVRKSFTTAQVNAGATILGAVPGFKWRVQDMSLIAVGGNAATATSVDIIGTQSASAVKLLDGRVAGLTQNTLLRAGTATNGLILAGGASFAQNDANTAITIGKTGSDLATATSVIALLFAVLEA